MSELRVVRWEDREVYDVSGALLLISGRVSVDQLLEGLAGVKALSLIAPFRLDDFGYTARAGHTMRTNFEGDIGIVVPITGSRREREDFIAGSHEAGFAPIVIHERTVHPALDRWLPYLEQARILVLGGWYHAAGWEFDLTGVGRWTRSVNFGEPA